MCFWWIASFDMQSERIGVAFNSVEDSQVIFSHQPIVRGQTEKCPLFSTQRAGLKHSTLPSEHSRYPLSKAALLKSLMLLLLISANLSSLMVRRKYSDKEKALTAVAGNNTLLAFRSVLQQRTYSVIVDYWAQNQCFPSYRTLQKLMNWSSPQVVVEVLAQLVGMGVLVRQYPPTGRPILVPAGIYPINLKPSRRKGLQGKLATNTAKKS